MKVYNTANSLNANFYPEAVGKLNSADTDSNALPGVSLSVDDLGYIKTGNHANSGKSFTPTQAQLDAMNSGITSEGVEQITTNKNNISSLTTPIIGGVTWSSDYTPSDEKVYIRQYGNIVVVQVSALFLRKLPSSSSFEIGTLTGVGVPAQTFAYTAHFTDNFIGLPSSIAGITIRKSPANKIYVSTGTVGDYDYCLNFSFVYCTA